MPADGISVILPAYNVDGFIAEAFASIAAQTKSVHEILIIDDGSTDGTAAWLRDMARKDARLRVLTSDRLGPSGARNVGLRAATQSTIAFLDADDAWPRDKIERQMDRLSAADRPDIVSGQIRRFRKLKPGTLTPDGEPGELMVNVNLGACLFRRRVFDTVGRLNERLLHCEDLDLMFRVREVGLKVAIMREVTLYYRIRPGSWTQTKSTEGQNELGALAALRLSIGRRRSAGRALVLPPFTSLIDG
jgi:glycosyltransferase involved in cell wall biosynthesis